MTATREILVGVLFIVGGVMVLAAISLPIIDWLAG
jgi:hypothetical protein